MFEKVLKRLCPCYFNQPDESDLSGCANKTSDVKSVPRLAEEACSDHSHVVSNTSSNTSNKFQENWKGTLNLVQPQPFYAFPIDSKKTVKRNQKSLLKPPLYWKKTMKNLLSEGPPVFQESKKKKPSRLEKKKRKPTLLKHSDTVADISSLNSENTTEIRWLRSQSLDNITCETSEKDRKFVSHKKKGHVNRKYGGEGNENGRKDWNCLKCQVFPDIANGVILFTAVYFSKKKICVVNIDRLENLSRKGRDGNSYCTVVKLGVLPCEKYVKCSKILNNSSNPEVKQDFIFSIKDLMGKILRLSVFDASLQKQHEAVGHALLNLDSLVHDQSKKYRIKLYRRTQPHVCPGNLALSLNYSTSENKFTMTVDKGRNLTLQKDKNVKLNTYVKVSLYSYGEKVKTKKSIVVMNSRDPNYNSIFTFQIRKDQIDHLSVSVTVRLKGFVNDVTIGKLNFGPFFFVESHKLTPWGRVFLKRELVSHWFRMYL